MNVIQVEVTKGFRDECEDMQSEVMENDLCNVLQPQEVMQVYQSHSLHRLHVINWMDLHISLKHLQEQNMCWSGTTWQALLSSVMPNKQGH